MGESGYLRLLLVLLLRDRPAEPLLLRCPSCMLLRPRLLRLLLA